MPDHVPGASHSTEESPLRGSTTRPLWLAVILLGGAIAAGGVGVLFRLVGSDPVTTLGAAGAAFIGAVSLGFASWKFLTE